MVEQGLYDPISYLRETTPRPLETEVLVGRNDTGNETQPLILSASSRHRFSVQDTGDQCMQVDLLQKRRLDVRRRCGLSAITMSGGPDRHGVHTP